MNGQSGDGLVIVHGGEVKVRVGHISHLRKKFPNDIIGVRATEQQSIKFSLVFLVQKTEVVRGSIGQISDIAALRKQVIEL